MGDGLFPPALPGDKAPSHVLLVAGGVGIAPLYFSAQQLAALQIPTCLFYGGRSGEYLYGIDEFSSLGIEVMAATEDGSRGERGLVTDRLRRFLEARPASGVIYACGPEPDARGGARGGCLL